MIFRNINTYSSVYRFYRWQNSYFLKESFETTDLPSKSDIVVFNENPDEALVLLIGHGYGNETSHAVVFKHDTDQNRWIKCQKMHFKKDYIEHYIFNGTLYLIGCSSDCKCLVFLVSETPKINNFYKIKQLQHFVPSTTGMIISFIDVSKYRIMFSK